VSKQANKTAIGGFVVGAIALVVAGILIFSGSKFLVRTETFVMYFEGSVKGLNVGAPVIFRGVKIGSVKSIVMRYDPKTLKVQIPVLVEIIPANVDTRGIESTDPKSQLERLIEMGLRAQLGSQSFVTGQLQIELDFYPDEEARLVGNLLGTDEAYPEIPTIQSSFERMTKKVEKLPLDEIANKLSSSLAGIDQLVNSPELPEMIHALKLTLNDTRKLINNVDAQIKPLATSIDKTVKDFGKLARDADKQIEPLGSGMKATVKDVQKLVNDIDKKTLPQIDATVKDIQKTFVDADDLVDEDSKLVYEMENALMEISAMARSMRELADYLKRHPESLLRGKGGSGRR
jgi:paraquat-inducible protein B